MTVSLAPERAASLMTVEVSLTAIAVALAFWLPRLGSGWFSNIEHAFARLARKQGLAVVTVGLAAILLRLAILPMVPIPHPFVPDDFSFQLAADTFASGRLTNPTPAMWVHFETIHISMKPTYMSMYFPAHGLILAASKVLLGHPWWGVLCVTALMCAAVCWMLQAWLPPTWALLGGIVAVLHLGLFSYWINTYHAASVVALGGTLVLGAIPRFMKRPGPGYGFMLAAGIILLATSRPYEGILLCLPVSIALGQCILFGKNRRSLRVLVRSTAIPIAMIVATISWMGYYDYRAFGSPLTPPYKINRAAYAMAPYYIWQSPRPELVYRHKVMREFYYANELKGYIPIRQVGKFSLYTLIKFVRGILFFSGIALLPPLIMLPRVLTDRRIRLPLICLFILAAGMFIEVFLLPHYLAACTAAFYAIGLQCMRHLRVWKPEGRPVGTALVRFMVTLCFFMCGIRLFAEPLHFKLPEWPASKWNSEWYGPGPFGGERAHIEDELEHELGKQLVIVKYSSRHNPIDEWVYNAPDIDNSKVIWAREMDDADNLELIHYYKDRKVWLVQPDLQPAGLTPYQLSGTHIASPTLNPISAAKREKKVQSGD